MAQPTQGNRIIIPKGGTKKGNVPAPQSNLARRTPTMASLRRRARHAKHLHRIAPPADVVGSHLQAAAGRELSEEVEGPDVTEADE